MEGVLNSGEFVVPFSNKENAQENVNLKNEKLSKRKVIAAMRDKLEETKLSIIKEKFIEKNIIFPDNVTSIKDLEKELKNNLSKLEYNECHSIIQSVSDQFNATVNSLEAGSKTAFTKLMTSETSKSIAKSLGISLTGRTLLMLAPTVASKILVATGIGGYYVVNAVKNRKSVKAANISNELNHILLDLEATVVDGKYTDTRFNKENQQFIREFLSKNNVYYTYTGYKSLMNAVYGLDDNLKYDLINQLNSKLAKGVDIDKRIEAAGKKLNVAAATVSAVGTGLNYADQITGLVNDISPSITAAPINAVLGGFLGNWLSNKTGKSWIKWLTAGVSGVGTILLDFFAKDILKAENRIIFSSLGASIGFVAGPALFVISEIKDLLKKRKLNKKFDEYNTLDVEKYKNDDMEELEKIKSKNEKEIGLDDIVLDLALGFLKDNNININGNPQNIGELNLLIDNLNDVDKNNAKKIVNNLKNSILSDKELVLRNVKKVTSVTGALLLSGFSALSLYDIVKGGTFLPELSKKIFPQSDNINVQIANIESLDDIINTYGEMKDEDAKALLAQIYSEVEDTAVPIKGTAFGIKTGETLSYKFDFGESPTLQNLDIVQSTQLNRWINKNIDYIDRTQSLHSFAKKSGGIFKGRLYEYFQTVNPTEKLSKLKGINSTMTKVGNTSVPILTTYSGIASATDEYEKDSSHLHR